MSDRFPADPGAPRISLREAVVAYHRERDDAALARAEKAENRLLAALESEAIAMRRAEAAEQRVQFLKAHAESVERNADRWAEQAQADKRERDDYRRKLDAFVSAVEIAIRDEPARGDGWLVKALAPALHAAQEPAVTPPPMCDRCGAVMLLTPNHPDDPSGTEFWLCADAMCGMWPAVTEAESKAAAERALGVSSPAYTVDDLGRPFVPPVTLPKMILVCSACLAPIDFFATCPCGSIDKRRRFVPAAPPAGEVASAPSQFEAWFTANYPPGSIISNPVWHVGKIWRAAHRKVAS